VSAIRPQRPRATQFVSAHFGSHCCTLEPRQSGSSYESRILSGVHLLNNPYEAPIPGVVVRDSVNSLWHRQLPCPNCGRNSIGAGRAFLLDPQFRIRCHSCGQRCRIRFERSDWWRMQAAWFGLLAFVCMVFGCSMCLDPFETLDQTMWALSENLWRPLIGKWRARIIGLSMSTLFLVPCLFLSFRALRCNLRLIVHRARLTPAHQPSNSPFSPEIGGEGDRQAG